MAAEWLVEEWVKQIVQVIESMTGEKPECKVLDGSATTDDEAFWWEQNFSLAEHAGVWTGAPAAAWKEIGGRVLKAAGVEDGGEADIKSTYQEVLNQSLSGLAQTFSSRLRREVTCSNGHEGRPSRADYATSVISLKTGDQQVTLSVVISSELLTALEAGESEGLEPKKAEPAPLVPKTAMEAATSKLELLLDVELPVSVSFGRAQIPLKDVLKLTTGSIVELNRAVSEPVELIVNNCVIARGQVVVVEGNFGVRIQQVISRQDRLRTLK